MSYHEAGHAVISHILGVPVKEVSIRKQPHPEYPEGPKIIGGHYVSGPYDECPEFSKQHYFIFRMIFELAGYYTEEKKFKSNKKEWLVELDLHAEGDFKTVFDFMKLLSDHRLASEVFSCAIATVIELIEVPSIWHLIECTAQALLESTELTGAEFAELASEFFDDEDIKVIQEDFFGTSTVETN